MISVLEIRCDRLKLLIMSHFYPPHKNQKYQNFEIIKNLLEMSFYTCVPKTTIIIWGMVPEIRSETDKNFFILRQFFPSYPLATRKIKILKKWRNIWRCHDFTNAYQKSWSYDVCFLRYGVRQTWFFVILDHFLPFYSATDPKH